MVQPPTNPDAARGWLKVALEALEKGTAVTLLLILLIGAMTAYYFLREVKRQRDLNVDLWQRLLASEKAQVELAVKCREGAPR